MSPPTLIFGAGFLGVNFATPSELQELLDFLQKNDIKRIDTARRYPAVNSGRSEQLLGEVNAARQGFTMDTKIKVVGSDASGSLTAAKIKESVAESLEALRVEQVNMLHCHMPDLRTPLEETAKAFDDVYKEGKFKKVALSLILHTAFPSTKQCCLPPQLGLANHTVSQIESWMRICDERGYVKPSRLPGANTTCSGRRREDDLLPVLRKHGMAFNAYSPLAGGFLTGAATSGHTAGTRFEPGNPMGAAHSAWYDKPAMHAAGARRAAELVAGGGGAAVGGVPFCA